MEADEDEWAGERGDQGEWVRGDEERAGDWGAEVSELDSGREKDGESSTSTSDGGGSSLW